MKLARCARSDSHSVRALRAVKSHPCGAGLHSNGRGAAPVLVCVVHFSNAHPFCRPFFVRWCRHKLITKMFCTFCVDANATHMHKVCWGGPTYDEPLHHMPVEVLRRRFAAPLFVTIVLTRCEDRREIFFSFILSGFSRPLGCTVCSFRCGPHSSPPSNACLRELCVRVICLYGTFVLTRRGGRRGIYFPAYIEMDLISSSFPAFFFLSSCAAPFVRVMFIRPGAECA